MTEIELLTEISAKLSTVIDGVDSLIAALAKGFLWFNTPAGDFGVFARVTFGEMLLGLLVVGLLGLKVVHLLYDVLAPRGWW